PTSRSSVALTIVGAVVADSVHVDRGDPPVFSEADLDASEDSRPRAADEVLVFARDAHHHRRVGLLREQRWNRHRDGARNLAAEAAAGVLADDHDLIRRRAGPARDGCHGLYRAL